MNRSYFKYILSLLLFGFNGIIASFISLNSYEIVFSRALIGSMFLIAVLCFSPQKSFFTQILREKKKSLLYLIMSGAAMGASWMFLYEAYEQIGVSMATLAYYCGPVIVIVLAPVVFGEKITLPAVGGFLAVMLGMLLLNGADLSSGRMSWGLTCGILSALMFSIMVIFNKKAEGITGLTNAVFQLVFACIVIGVFTLFKHTGEVVLSWQSIAAILLLGLVNTGAGCYLYFSSMQRLSAQSISILGYLEPLSALFFSAMFLHERLTMVQVVGTLLILGGAAFGELYPRSSFALNKRQRMVQRRITNESERN